MSTSKIIYETTTRKLSDFNNLTNYINSYQAAFDKITSLFADSLLYTWASTKTYLQVTMLMNIESKYFTLISSIQKEWKITETTNLAETIL